MHSFLTRENKYPQNVKLRIRNVTICTILAAEVEINIGTKELFIKLRAKVMFV